MTYLELVQTAMKRAKVRSGVPTTLSGAVDAALSFKEYVGDAWRELQEETPNWWFRQKLDQTMIVHPAYSATPDTSDLIALNIYPDPNMTGSGITYTDASGLWSFTGGNLVSDDSGLGGMIEIDQTLSPNTTYYLTVVHNTIPSPDREFLDVYADGSMLGRILDGGTYTYTFTTGATTTDTIGFENDRVGYLTSISNVYLSTTNPLGSGDEYNMPTGLETINYRTVTVYETAKQDETPVTKMSYETWRTVKDTLETSASRPEYIVERPDGVLQVWPVPDKPYTLRFDGVWEIDEMTVDADTPGSNVSGGTLLPDRFHWVIVYDACRRFYEDHEDAEGIQKMQNKYLAQRARLSEKQTPPIYVRPGVLTGWSWRARRYW
jgi:hypothetical protein